MNKKYYVLGIFFIWILIFCFNSGITRAIHDEEGQTDEGSSEKPEDETPCEDEGKLEDETPCEEESEKPDNDIDADKDGIDDSIEEKYKREVNVWCETDVIKISSKQKTENSKDIIELKVKCGEWGVGISVYFGNYIKAPTNQPEIPYESKKISISGGESEYILQSELSFEVKFQEIIEYIDLNDNGIYDYKNDNSIQQYLLNSFQNISYSVIEVSNDTSLYYILINTTDGIYTTHIYFSDEFISVNEALITPTQIKIDIEITNFNYMNNSSQLALLMKLFSQETNYYKEREETYDEKEGYATEEKEVYIKNDNYNGIFSWKETAFIDSVEMPVLTNTLEFGDEHKSYQKLLFNYPRGNHIYHDPKIGISGLIGVSNSNPSLTPVIIIGTTGAVIGVATIAGIALHKRQRIIKW